jgi:hypothetical protein
MLLETNSYAKKAPVLICAIAKKTCSEEGKYNRLHFHDLGAANENMFLEAFSQGLIMHEMGGYDLLKAAEVFRIPEDFGVGMMIAIGCQDKHRVLPERFREKAFALRVRKSLSNIVFAGELGKSIE